MQTRSVPKRSSIHTIFVAAATSFEAFSALGFGLIYLFIILIGDPVDFSIETKNQGIRVGEAVALATLVYLVLCFVALAQWRKQKPRWIVVMLALTLVHLAAAASILAVDRQDDTLGLLPHASIAIDATLIATLLRELLMDRMRSDQTQGLPGEDWRICCRATPCRRV